MAKGYAYFRTSLFSRTQSHIVLSVLIHTKTCQWIPSLPSTTITPVIITNCLQSPPSLQSIPSFSLVFLQIPLLLGSQILLMIRPTKRLLLGRKTMMPLWLPFKLHSVWVVRSIFPLQRTWTFPVIQSRRNLIKRSYGHAYFEKKFLVFITI